MKVSEAMAKTISTVTPSDPIRKVAQTMKQEDSGFIPVCENDRLVGVITDRDIVIRGLAGGDGNILDQPAERLMSREVRTVEADADIDSAGETMSRYAVRRLPVVDHGRLVGILSHGNLVQATKAKGPAEKATLGVTKGA